MNEKGQSYDVNFAILQDKYDKPYHDNLALVRIVGDIKFNTNVKPVALPTSDFTDYNRDGEISGWFTKVMNQLPNI